MQKTVAGASLTLRSENNRNIAWALRHTQDRTRSKKAAPEGKQAVLAHADAVRARANAVLAKCRRTRNADYRSEVVNSPARACAQA